MTATETNIPTVDQLAASDMVAQTFNYWFADHEHVRSPFPFYVQDDVKMKAVGAFHAWMSKLNAKANEEITEEIAHEKFEEILFEQAAQLVKTDDEILTLRFPFLPRLGDPIDGGDIEGRSGENLIRGRLLVSEDKDEFMEMTVENVASAERWTTRFELP